MAYFQDTPALRKRISDFLCTQHPQWVIEIWDECVYQKHPRRIVATWIDAHEDRLLDDLSPSYLLKHLPYDIKAGCYECLWRDDDGRVCCGSLEEGFARISVQDMINYIFDGDLDDNESFMDGVKTYLAAHPAE